VHNLPRSVSRCAAQSTRLTPAGGGPGTSICAARASSLLERDSSAPNRVLLRRRSVVRRVRRWPTAATQRSNVDASMRVFLFVVRLRAPTSQAPRLPSSSAGWCSSRGDREVPARFRRRLRSHTLDSMRRSYRRSHSGSDRCRGRRSTPPGSWCVRPGTRSQSRLRRSSNFLRGRRCRTRRSCWDQ
jgi:hypothetical protein